VSGWVFGYGSLVWRPDFPFEERRPGWVSGWTRRFWQASTDHRGTPAAPGRVVTLVEAAGMRCWGMAYRISAEVREAVFAHLDHREKGGYERHAVAIHSDTGQAAVQGVVYLATAENPHYLGDAPLASIAAQIAVSHGPSGPNSEYLLRLAATLRDHGEHDEHVFALERLLLDRHGSDVCGRPGPGRGPS
jgi:cation transport regulator ChaC